MNPHPNHQKNTVLGTKTGLGFSPTPPLLCFTNDFVALHTANGQLIEGQSSSVNVLGICLTNELLGGGDEKSNLLFVLRTVCPEEFFQMAGHVQVLGVAANFGKIPLGQGCQDVTG